MLLNRRRVLIGSLVMLAVAVVLTVIIANHHTRDGVQVVDDWFLRRMRGARSSTATSVLKGISTIGGPLTSWTLRAVAVVVLVARRRFLQLGAFATAIVTSELCVGPLKALIDRPRPLHPLVVTSGAAYPSGHAIAISVTAIGLVVALLPPGRRRLRWEVAAAGLTFLMALSRTYLGAHWLSDVVGGSLIGSGLALFWPAAFEEVRARRPSATGRPTQSAAAGATAGGGVPAEDRRRI
jgi:undecaprenyl-diphosphatase